MWCAIYYAFVPVFATTSAFCSNLLNSLHHFYKGNCDCGTVDPATGLSSREKRLVRKSWAIVRKDAKSAGTGFFLALFDAHPKYQELFGSLSGLQRDEMIKNTFFVSHSLSVINAVSLIVDSLDDTTFLVALLKRVAKSHGRRGITERHFQNVSAVLVDFLEAVLGKSNFDETTRKSWIHVLDVAVSVIKPELTDV